MNEQKKQLLEQPKSNSINDIHSWCMKGLKERTHNNELWNAIVNIIIFEIQLNDTMVDSKLNGRTYPQLLQMLLGFDDNEILWALDNIRRVKFFQQEGGWMVKTKLKVIKHFSLRELITSHITMLKLKQKGVYYSRYDSMSYTLYRALIAEGILVGNR